MDYITSKVFVIAIGIFTTLTIVGGVILVFSQMGSIYEFTENTNTSIISQYNNIHSMYNSSKHNTVGLLNTLRKYEENAEVDISVKFNDGTILYASNISGMTKKQVIQNLEMKIDSGNLGYEEMFDVSVKEQDLTVVIEFKKR